MKKILLSLLAAAALATVSQAGMWSVVTTMDMKKVKPQAEYKLDTAGWAPRVYEFTTVTKPTMQCVVVFSASNEGSSPSMQCIPKVKGH